jgi:uncharacterized membrane protein YqjE
MFKIRNNFTAELIIFPSILQTISCINVENMFHFPWNCCKYVYLKGIICLNQQRVSLYINKLTSSIRLSGFVLRVYHRIFSLFIFKMCTLINSLTFMSLYIIIIDINWLLNIWHVADGIKLLYSVFSCIWTMKTWVCSYRINSSSIV